MTKQQAQFLCTQKFGHVRLEEKRYVLPTPNVSITMCYAWRGDVIVAIGKTWEDLLK